jgi:hypothetical protein
VNSWDPSLRKMQPLQQAPPDWFEVFMPLPAASLVILLILVLPIFLLTAESLFAPVYDFVRSLLMPVNAGIAYTSLPFLLLVKIVIFCIFTFTGLALLLLKISCLYHEVWAHFFQQPHPQHTPYHPEQQASMISLFNWNLFRWYRVLSPFVGWLAVTIVSASILMWLFNSFTDFSFFTFQMQFTLGFFIMSVLGLFTAIALVKTLWAAFTTILGDVAAITEPEKPTQILYDRTRKLAFLSPWGMLLYPMYFIFYVALIVEIVLLLVNYDIQDLLSFKVNVLPIFGIELLTFGIFILLSVMKFMAYHDALYRYYNRFVR